MGWPVCSFCGCPAIPSVGAHIAYTESCLTAQIDTVLIQASESEGPEDQ